MKHLLQKLATILFASALLAFNAQAQQAAPEAAAEPKPAVTKDAEAVQPATNAPASPTEASERKNVGDIIRVMGNAVLNADEECQDLVVIFGKATVNGIVHGDLVVVGGDAVINNKVHRDAVVIGGNCKLGPKADIKHDFVVVGGSLDRDPGAKTHRQPVEIGTSNNFPAIKWALDWITKGLLLARPLPPSVGWAWIVAGTFFVVYLLLGALFPRPVQVCVDTLEARPVGSFLTGLLLKILFAPACLLLAFTGVGLLVIPFLFFTMVGAFLIGKLAVLRFTGQQIGRQLGGGFQNPILALIVGSVIFCLLYMVPVLGFITWGVATVMGMGTVLLAGFTRLRKESGKGNGNGNSHSATGAIPPMSVATATGEAPASMEVTALPRAGFWIRTAAAFLDFVILIVPTVITHFPPAFLVLSFAYHVGMWAWKGTTLGGVVFGLKVVREDGRPVDFAVALVRSLASIFSFMVLCLGFFWAGWTREKRSWHDLIAGTIIVKMPKGVPLI
jgi:uncharacterized RDD family membrane protein YckC